MPSPFTRRGRELKPGQRAELTIMDAASGKPEVIYTADEIIEAPNWTPDGSALIFNAGGEIWQIGIDGQNLKKIETGSIRDFNNDHVLSPDGKTVYLSSNDGHLYSVPIEGGEPKRVSNEHPHPHHYYLHGISPDGQTLSYVAVEGAEGKKRVNIFTIPSAGGPDKRMTDVDYPNDGPEYSPDGKWLYFSGEKAAKRPGHAQCFRLELASGGVDQLTFDNRVNWFPHISPDGQRVVYISYPEGTLGHPPDKNVILRLMDAEGQNAHDVAAFNGGQGTINVNSWSPDSQRFAYVTYPIG